MQSKPEYVIIQAGGKGTRLEELTANKPKALVPVFNLPILFHLFRTFPDSKHIIIADYKKDVLEKYLNCFAGKTDWQIISAEGTGTCAGIADAAALVPEGEPVLLIWSDLILPDEKLSFPEKEEVHYIGLSDSFLCRWMYEDGVLSETPSDKSGVAGIFRFGDSSVLKSVPASGEFVRWLSSADISLHPWFIRGLRDFGTAESVRSLPVERCRPFNRITISGNTLTKLPLDEQGKELAEKEQNWYAHVCRYGYKAIPEIYANNPLQMENIAGMNVFEYSLKPEEKTRILVRIVEGLNELHEYSSIPGDRGSMYDTYYQKTVSRLHKVRSLIPFSDRKIITVNGRSCRNVFFHLEELENRISRLDCDRFPLIHGDCTFSNILLKDRATGEVVFIDPRGYFGNTLLYGDPRYDWAKLYYSIIGNYDSFNLKRFTLTIGGSNGSRGTDLDEGEVKLEIRSEGWEELGDTFFALIPADPDEIRLIHALIWLSLTSYAWNDYDSVCGAFYNGIYYFEEAF